MCNAKCALKLFVEIICPAYVHNLRLLTKRINNSFEVLHMKLQDSFDASTNRNKKKKIKCT